MCAESCIQPLGWWCCTMWWQHLWPWSTWVLMQTSVWVSREMGELGFLSTCTHLAHGVGVGGPVRTKHTDMAEDSCLHIKTWKVYVCVSVGWGWGGAHAPYRMDGDKDKRGGGQLHFTGVKKHKPSCSTFPVIQCFTSVTSSLIQTS